LFSFISPARILPGFLQIQSADQPGIIRFKAKPVEQMPFASGAGRICAFAGAVMVPVVCCIVAERKIGDEAIALINEFTEKAIAVVEAVKAWGADDGEARRAAARIGKVKFEARSGRNPRSFSFVLHCGLAKLAVEGFDCVGRVDHPACTFAPTSAESRGRITA